MIRTSFAVAAAAAAGFSLAQPAFGQTDDTKLGQVHFETSCAPQAQKHFDRAMLYQHSFWYRASQMAFEDVLKADPECGMAYWGIALSLLWNPHVPAPAKNLAEGAAAIAKGKSLGAKTQRERDYIDALAVIYADHDKLGHLPRTQAYAKAMEQVAQRYPSDDEAQVHYALALNTSAAPADKTYASQLKGAAILEPIFERQPQHPGVAHYLIHLYDYPPIAEKGLNAARLYAKIAPDAAHAQHMPSHIFTRVGYWQESIDSNAVAARVAKEAKDFHDQLHSMDYLVYAYLQLGQDQKAKAVMDGEGTRDDARAAMSAAADAEDRTEKHPVTPGVPKPARELYGVMLLESGKPAEALAAFEATLSKEPNRLGATVGAAKAAEKAGDNAKAQEYYKKVIAIAGDADKSRTEVSDARAFLTKKS